MLVSRPRTGLNATSGLSAVKLMIPRRGFCSGLPLKQSTIKPQQQEPQQSQLFDLKDIESGIQSNNALLIHATKYRSTKVPSLESTVHDRVNLTNSIAQYQLLTPPSKIRNEMLSKDPKISFSNPRVYYRVLKTYLTFFKSGLVNVWKLNGILNKQVFNKERYVIENGLDTNKDVGLGDSKDRKVSLKKANIDNITDELNTAIRCLQNEQIARGYKSIWETNNDNKNNNQGENGENNIIRLNRSEYMMMLRNRIDFPRLPVFGVLFMLIEEFAFVLCYLYPAMTPTTCVFPLFMSRYYSRAIKAQEKLTEKRKGKGLEEVGSLNPFSVNSEEVSLMCDFLQVTTTNLNPFITERIKRERLLRKLKEIRVDNYLLVRDGGIYRLNKLELISSCMERGLIDLQAVVNKIKNSGKGGLDFMGLFDVEEMRGLLLQFVVESEDPRNEVGLLGMRVTCK